MKGKTPSGRICLGFGAVCGSEEIWNHIKAVPRQPVG